MRNREHGSSPRVRGTDQRRVKCHSQIRFIPACAGNSGAMTRSAPSCPVHPRVCGEQAYLGSQAVRSGGSSPRVRGTGKLADSVMGVERFIPACAGNSQRGSRYPECKPVHPRVCGEQAGRDAHLPRNRGSSPRVRGTGNVALNRHRLLRFIPACAGNSSRARATGIHRAVHPRVCGEQDVFVNAYHRIRGSSPRVRGTDFLEAFVLQ
ncbi:hypothetical protein SAMN05421849_2138 [Pontibaca methylaminivorans]|uniref:Uncharacterized protein n=1 Tax=Pontibaca methylaminivorans TaxID=515897 RepID=A0A1R3X1X6_9RHOB|nr:hypothetical protein SAMN05421849_2138 [Pontibaca methylaminivorans]